MKKNTRAEKLAKVAQDNTFAVANLAAQGVESAAVELYKTACLATHWLTLLYYRKPDMVTAIAQEKFSWPVLYGPHPDSVKRTDELIKNLQVGAKTSFNLSAGKTFSWDVPANVVALNLHQLAQNLRRAPMRSWTERDLHPIAACGIGRTSVNVHKYNARYVKQLKALEAWGQCGAGKRLPPLSKQTARQWATATKELFRIAYPGDFEQHPNLQELRVSVLGRARTVYGKPGGSGIIRAAMLRAVKQAWSSIAALD